MSWLTADGVGVGVGVRVVSCRNNVDVIANPHKVRGVAANVNLGSEESPA